MGILMKVNHHVKKILVENRPEFSLVQSFGE
jgi:hypothetical protein